MDARRERRKLANCRRQGVDASPPRGLSVLREIEALSVGGASPLDCQGGARRRRLTSECRPDQGSRLGAVGLAEVEPPVVVIDESVEDDGRVVWRPRRIRSLRHELLPWWRPHLGIVDMQTAEENLEAHAEADSLPVAGPMGRVGPAYGARTLVSGSRPRDVDHVYSTAVVEGNPQTIRRPSRMGSGGEKPFGAATCRNDVDRRALDKCELRPVGRPNGVSRRVEVWRFAASDGQKPEQPTVRIGHVQPTRLAVSARREGNHSAGW